VVKVWWKQLIKANEQLGECLPARAETRGSEDIFSKNKKSRAKLFIQGINLHHRKRIINE